jgi:hypothetical protein
VKDWQRFKQLETEKRDEQQKEKNVLLKKLTMSCRSYVSSVIILCNIFLWYLVR